ncbi:hypothetical protein BH11PSE11_BH11PSE11_15130 [soil metagenome]
MSEAAGNNQATNADGAGQQAAGRSPQSPGAQLATLRQQRGWTIDEVATQLNLAPRQIQALEADNYSALPGMASVRGFIRGYAKILKLDPLPLLALIANETAHLAEPFPPRPALSEPFSDNRLASAGKRSSSWPAAGLVIFLVLLVIGAFIGQQMGWIHALPEEFHTKLTELSAAGTNVPSKDTTVEGAANFATVSPPVESATRSITEAVVVSPPAPASVSAPLSASVAVVAPSVAPIAAVAPSSPQGAPLPSSTIASPNAVPKTARPVATGVTPSRDVPGPLTDQRGANVAALASGNNPPGAESPRTASRNALIVKPREDSWIEIVRANHTTVMSRLVKGGTVEAVDVTEPVSLTIGNAAAVEVILRGAPVDLRGSTKSNVARVTLR